MAYIAAPPLASGPGAGNADQSLTIPGRNGLRVCIYHLSVSYVGGAVTGRVLISQGQETGANRYDADVTAAGLTVIANGDTAWEFDMGQPVVITAKAGGAAVVGKVNVGYRYKDE